MKRILIFGDSNTFGCNPEASDGSRPDVPFRFPKNVRWTGVLASLLGESYEVIEEGLPGRSAALPDPFEPFLQGTSSFQAIARSHYPLDLLVFVLGTNDLKFARSAEHVALAMEALLKMALNPFLWVDGKAPEILLVSPTRVREGIMESCFSGMYTAESVEMSERLGALYEKLADTYGCAFLDAAAFAEASPVDCLHMDPENHARLAAAMAEKIKML